MFNKIKVSVSGDLRKKYGVRSFPVTVGDIVKIKSGKRKGEGGKVIEVDHAGGRISVEGITSAKADGKQKALFLLPNDVTITKLDFSREDRIQKLKKIAAIKRITIEEPEPEEAPKETEAEVEEVKESDTLEGEAEAVSEEENEENPEEESESE